MLKYDCISWRNWRCYSWEDSKLEKQIICTNASNHASNVMNFKVSHWCYVAAVSSAFAYRYDHPWYRTDTERPVDVITDVVNELGVRILQQYLTRGNVAFSPTGIAFVLAALYEGSAGRGSQQIAEAIGLPTNRDVTRIGFRDIHRRLRVRFHIIDLTLLEIIPKFLHLKRNKYNIF